MTICLRMSSSPANSPTDSRSAHNYKRSRSCGNSIDIDSRIARAMDLVKTHMLSAVREEVEPLREKIKNLVERNLELEKENYLLRSMAKYRTAQISGQITDLQAALTSGQITNLQAALTSGQITNLQAALISGQITNLQAALTSGQITNLQAALTSGQITNLQAALISGQITNLQAALTSGQITNLQAALTSGQITNLQAALISGQITNLQAALNSNHHCNQHDISIPERAENFIIRSVDYQNSGYFSVNKNLYLNATLKQEVT